MFQGEPGIRGAKVTFTCSEYVLWMTEFKDLLTQSGRTLVICLLLLGGDACLPQPPKYQRRERTAWTRRRTGRKLEKPQISSQLCSQTSAESAEDFLSYFTHEPIPMSAQFLKLKFLMIGLKVHSGLISMLVLPDPIAVSLHT